MPDESSSSLGSFLRHRRGLITPDQVGLPNSTRRRVPGLRREELAIVAGISPDHYQRIEQGRVRASVQALEALASALRLDAAERSYLLALGGFKRNQSHSPCTPSHQPGEDIQELLDAFHGPAYLLNHRRDVLAWNAIGATLITDFADLPRHQRNIAWVTFTDPAMRVLYQEWAIGAQEQVAVLRRASGLHPQDQQLKDLISRLNDCSPDFARWWQEQRVVEKASGSKVLNHPIVGRLHLRFHTLHVDYIPDCELFLYLPGSADTRRKLAKLDQEDFNKRNPGKDECCA